MGGTASHGNRTAGLASRPLAPPDVPALTALAGRVGWPYREADVRMLLELGRGVALFEGQTDSPLAVGLWWPNGDHAATLGMVIVAPDRQGQGLGGRVMRELLEDAGERAIRLFATQEGAPLYERLDFVAVGAVLQHQGRLIEGCVVPAAVRRATAADLDEAVRLDTRARGAPREAIVRRLARAGETWVLVRRGVVEGYCIARAFGHGTVVGPIVAASESEAIALFDAAAPPGFVRVDCPAEATGLRSHLRGRGLEPVSTVTVMHRGGWPGERDEHTPGPSSFGIASQSLG